MAEYLYQELSYAVLGAAMEVHRVLGPGFLEFVYRQALAHELSLREISYSRETPLNVRYKGIQIGQYRTDFIIADKIILEIKAMNGLIPAHEAQALHYLAGTGLRLALLLNFGTESLQIKRLIR